MPLAFANPGHPSYLDIDWGHDHGYGNPHYHKFPGGIRDSGNRFQN